MRRSIIVGLVAATILCGFALVSRQITPTQAQTDSNTNKIKVITSFYPLYEFSKNIGGTRAEISVFTPFGVEPHDWEPTAGNLIALTKSNLFVYNGVGMEPFVNKLVDSQEYSHIMFVQASSQIKIDESSKADPHVWLDPVFAKSEVNVIKSAMQKADPVNANYYENNTNNYLQKLDELDSKIKSELSNCKKDKIVTFHNAFAYFGKRYGIKINSLSGIAPESEITANDLKNLINYIKTEQIKVIFAEELIDPKLAEVLAEETGTKILTLSPLEGISKSEQAKNTSYFDKMQENLASLKEALECT